MFQDFNICINTRFIFGRGAEKQVGQEFAKLGVGRILIHHDGGSYLQASGLLDAIRESCDQAGVRYVELGGVQPNPRLGKVREGIDFARREGVEGVLAIGGGSCIDSAKAIGLGLAGDCDVWDYFTGKAEPKATLPVGAVLTCPASGSESSQVTVINNEEEHQKLLVSDPVVRPALAFMNPQLSESLPAFPTACGVVDMFSHICERYFTKDETFGLIDRMSEGALRTLTQIGPKSVVDGGNYEYRAQIMWASTIAQNNTLGVGREQDWSTHTIANELSALYDTPHGATLSIIMGSWMRYCIKKAPRRFARYAQEVFGIHDETMDVTDLALRGVTATENFFASMNMPISFADYLIPEDGIEQMLDKIDFYGPDQAIGSVVRLNRDDCRTILQMALGHDAEGGPSKAGAEASYSAAE